MYSCRCSHETWRLALDWALLPWTFPILSSSILMRDPFWIFLTGFSALGVVDQYNGIIDTGRIISRGTVSGIGEQIATNAWCSPGPWPKPYIFPLELRPSGAAVSCQEVFQAGHLSCWTVLPPIVQSEIHHKTAPAVDGVISAVAGKSAMGEFSLGKSTHPMLWKSLEPPKSLHFPQKYPAPMARPRLWEWIWWGASRSEPNTALQIWDLLTDCLGCRWSNDPTLKCSLSPDLFLFSSLKKMVKMIQLLFSIVQFQFRLDFWNPLEPRGYDQGHCQVRWIFQVGLDRPGFKGHPKRLEDCCYTHWPISAFWSGQIVILWYFSGSSLSGR